MAIILTSILRERLSRKHQEFRDGSVAEEKAQEILTKIGDNLLSDVEQQVRAATRELLLFELGLLAAGTLIWGFGDLLATPCRP